MDAARWSSQSQEMSSSSTPIPIPAPPSLTTYPTQNPSNPSNPRPQSVERRGTRPHQRGDQPLNCPRCNSTNTKFCYYNNYSLTQPRYFCKSCRRYWTEGGSLRNVPVGGGSRKNRKPSSSSFNPSGSNTNPNPSSDNKLPSGLNIGFNTFPSLESSGNVGTTSASTSAGMNSCGIFQSFGQMVPEFGTSFVLQDLRPTILGFPLDGSAGASGGYANMSSVQDNNNSRILFPFEDLKPVNGGENINQFEQNRVQTGDTNQPSSGTGFWNGMMGGGNGGPGSW